MANKIMHWKYPKNIVSCAWLQRHLKDENVRVYDCTTYLHYTNNRSTKPYHVESGFANYKRRRIPGAAFLDIQGKFSNNKSLFNFTLPESGFLLKNLQESGVGSPFHVILYASNALHWATRLWWLIHILGFRNVSILDGGLTEWQRLKYKVEKGESVYTPATFQHKFDHTVFVGKDRTLHSLNDSFCVLLNALKSDFHKGKNRRYGRAGRIPGSANIPASQFLEKNTQKLISPDKAFDLVRAQNIKKNTRVLNYCGGGIAATLNAFVLRQLGIENLEIYDNSMSEWAKDYNLPIETDS